MTPSFQALQEHYAELNDAALLRASKEADTLTPEAQLALREELRTRSLTAAEPVLEAEPEPQEAAHWVTVERFRDLSGAIVARGALEAADVPCFLRDENTVRLDWQISNFIGGMRLQVEEQDRDAALAILGQLTLGEAQQASDALPTGDLCPFCGSPEVHRLERGIGLRAAALWMFTLPLPRGPRYWKCDACGKEFADEDIDLSEER